MRNIFIACDTSSIQKVKKIIKQSQISIKGYRIGYKFGLEFLNSKSGRKFVSTLKNTVIFGDYKISDISGKIIKKDTVPTPIPS